jgi:hypothetical protein
VVAVLVFDGKLFGGILVLDWAVLGVVARHQAYPTERHIAGLLQKASPL